MEMTICTKLFKETSKYRELSQESRSCEHLEETSRKVVKRTLSRETQPQHSESQEYSQNSRIKQVGAVEVTVSVEDTKRAAASSDFPEDSQNSVPSGESEMDKGEVNVSFGDCDGQHLVTVSKFQELSPNSQVETECSEGTRKKHHIRPVCISEPSEYLRDLLGGVGKNVSVPSFSWFKSMSQIVGLTATWQDKVEGNPTGAGTASNAKINTNPVHTEFNFFL